MLAPRPVALSKRRPQTGEGGYVSGNVLVISAQETLRQEDWHDFKASQGCGMRNEFLVGCFEEDTLLRHTAGGGLQRDGSGQ